MKLLSFIAVAAACAALVIVPGTSLSQDAARKVKIDVTSTYPTSLTLVGAAVRGWRRECSALRAGRSR